jgi:hypothetical protein
MPSVPEFIAAVDAFMATPGKRLIGVESPTWQIGRNAEQHKLLLPIEVEGEHRGQSLMLLAYPTHAQYRYSIGVQFSDGLIPCRLDYDPAAVHPNTLDDPMEKLPSIVRGPHWHSWEVNRRHIGSLTHPLKLPSAEQLGPLIRTFDAVLRVYCSRRLIALAQHGIELPPKGLI